MSNDDKYRSAFIEGLGIEVNELSDELEYNAIVEWDSIGHMSLMSALEDAFEITLDTDDIVDFSSFQKGKEILQKYQVSV